MIESFADAETEKIFQGIASRKLPKDIQKTARRKLLYLEDAEDLRDLSAPPGNRLRRCTEIVRDSIVSASMTSGESASSGSMAKRETWKWLTIINKGGMP